jgi:hypothetical protein
MFLFFLEPNGSTNFYSIAPPTGYVVLPSSGNVTGYSSPTQSLDYATGSPIVILDFVPSDPPAAPATALIVSSLPLAPAACRAVLVREF